MKPFAIVTGASGGIGSAICVELAKAGYDLALLYHANEAAATNIAATCTALGCEANTYQTDLSDPASISTVFKKIVDSHKAVDLLVNVAGIAHIGLLQDMSDEEWMRMIQTNLSSVFYTCRQIIPAMLHKKRGKIINLSSVWGNVGASCEVAYSAAKGGINSFTKALAKELAPSNISVNAIACGMIDTPMNHCFEPEEVQAMCDEIPAGRMGTPQEVGELAVLLAQAPSYLTGQIITMDGGWT